MYYVYLPKPKGLKQSSERLSINFYFLHFTALDISNIKSNFRVFRFLSIFFLISKVEIILGDFNSINIFQHFEFLDMLSVND